MYVVKIGDRYLTDNGGMSDRQSDARRVGVTPTELAREWLVVIVGDDARFVRLKPRSGEPLADEITLIGTKD